jgi:hypothetical protein
MTLAWFRTTPLARAAQLDETAPAIAALGQTHKIDIVTAAEAHDFVWRQFRTPYDLTVFEVGADFDAFMRPYLLHYPGAAIVTGAMPRAARGAWQLHQACASSRLVIARDEALAARLQDEHPGIPVRYVPLALDPWLTRGQGGVDHGSTTGRPDPMRVAVVGAGRAEVVARALQRVRDAGANAVLADDAADADVVLALVWPGAGESLMPALAAMARRQAVVVFETEITAGWPAIDPQTGRPRPPAAEAPIAISIDPLDEEHSLVLAIRRLAGDAGLRDAIAATGHAWWQSHATIAPTLPAWRAAIDAAAAASAPAPPVPLADGCDKARHILETFGLHLSQLYPGSVVSRASSTGSPIEK